MISNVGGTSVFWSSPPKHSSPSCLVSTWSLAGCDCAEKGNTFQAYLGVRGLEEPIGGQLTAQSLLPATMENKKNPLKDKKKKEKKPYMGDSKGKGRVVNTFYKLASGSVEIIQVQPFPEKPAGLHSGHKHP